MEVNDSCGVSSVRKETAKVVVIVLVQLDPLKTINYLKR